MRIKNWWFVWAEVASVRWVSAEPPCMKGEIQIGRMVIGYQKKEKQS